MKRILTELVIDKIAAVDRPCQEKALVTIMKRAEDPDVDLYWKREFTQEHRDKLAGTGAAMKDGSFPIVTRTDLENAVRAYGRAKDPATAKAHIITRAKSMGATSALPAAWVSKLAEELQARLMMAKIRVLKVRANSMLAGQEEARGAHMPKRRPVSRNSQPMTKAWSDAARAAAAEARRNHRAHAEAADWHSQAAEEAGRNGAAQAMKAHTKAASLHMRAAKAFGNAGTHFQYQQMNKGNAAEEHGQRFAAAVRSHIVQSGIPSFLKY